ncbi:hypothetical protein IA51_04845 [Listeria monocytogenes]|uniref:hypothetical protein n=1 Tax=Listeria monocytogenes TaxID=1639 RepID=UPI0010D7E6E4|nr:hypothetical protein [Listeria monocytogenes]EAC8104232.1 hypothetical protein [Listeria monocytogenes]EHV5202845.1 hypothetical protein [Listeria monocytogenes]EKF1561071.1 hypothetical protein [Listeria monocytogenes]ELU8149926.1 hypothetical protein [Listeria monocytogenes]
MLLAARILVRIVCVLEFISACLFLKISVMMTGSEEEIITFLRVMAAGLFIHVFIGLVVTSFMTWYVSTKHIIYLIVSGFLLLLPNLMENVYVNLIGGFLYIFAGVLCIRYNVKAHEEVQEERERKETLNIE